MKVCFVGKASSHLNHWSTVGAAYRKLHVVQYPEDADLIVIAQDTWTDSQGRRNYETIEHLIDSYRGDKPVLLMSQVPPGFCRKQNMPNLYHYPETLRIKDAYERACNPEYIVIGCPDVNKENPIPQEILVYISAFQCPWITASYEEAEFSKIAVNTALAMQVDYANRMEAACRKIGADWDVVNRALKFDKRIGPHAYLTPGRWQDSIHLLRDAVTLKEIEDAN